MVAKYRAGPARATRAPQKCGAQNLKKYQYVYIGYIVFVSFSISSGTVGAAEDYCC